MKKSLHSSSRSTPAPLAVLGAMPAPTGSTGTGHLPPETSSSSCPWPSSNARLPKPPLPARRSDAVGSMPGSGDAHTFFSALPKGTGCLCQATTTRIETSRLANLTKLITKKPCPSPPSPRELKWYGGAPGWMGFLERDGSQAGDGQGCSAPTPEAHPCPMLTWGYVTYFWEKKHQMSPSPSCIANFRKE